MSLRHSLMVDFCPFCDHNFEAYNDMVMKVILYAHVVKEHPEEKFIVHEPTRR